MCDKQIVCRFELGKHSATGEANLNNEECLFTTQLPIISMDSIFHVSIFIPCIYSPDICAGNYHKEASHKRTKTIEKCFV